MVRRRPLDWGWVIGVACAAVAIGAAYGAVLWISSEDSWLEAAALATTALVIGGVGAVWLVKSYRGNRDTLQRNRLAALFPDQPWRWRPEWDAKRIPHTSRRWGTTTLELHQLPGLTGGHLRGAVAPSFRDVPAGGFHLTLRAVRVYVTGIGTRRRVCEDVLWEGRSSAALSATSRGPRVEFNMPIPVDAPPSNDDDPNDELVWRLIVAADVHGRAFAASFVVPVFS